MRDISQNEYVRQIELANLWKARAIAAAELCKYFSSVFYADGQQFIDVKKEIELQAARMLAQRKKGIELR